MTTLLWFKRDLRVSDHPASAQAVAMGAPILPVYVVEPEYWALPDTSARQWAFTAEALRSLRKDLSALGAPLIVRIGEVAQIFDQLAQRHRVTRIVSHEETGNAWTFARDLRVGAWARAASIDWIELPQCGVVRRLPSRDGWAKSRDAHVFGVRVDVPRTIHSVAGVDPGAIPSVDDLGLSPDGITDRQSGGRQEALSLLGGFLTERGRTYRTDMSTPLQGATACSRLSPHLAVGALSIREAAQAAGVRQREVRGTRDGWIGSLKSFQSRLAWRDHFIQKLEDEPELETRCLHSAYEGLRPKTPDTARLAAWETGETGLPFVDACMRSLIATGWLNFRMRSMLMAVASYHLWLDWRSSGPHLARMFTDYEPGIHWSQVQMQSGTTGMNTVRIYNPVKQGHDQDPTGAFTRRWVPELAEVPDTHLQTPWTWEGAGSLLGKRYPEPIVDLASAAKAAREKVWAVRKGGAFRAEAAQVVQKHASRKDRQGRFMNDRAPRPSRKSKASPDQMSLDL